MSSARPIELSASSSALPTVTPHLMPFHIDYTGPAPLSTYFLVKPAPPPEPSDQSETTLVQRVKARFLSAFRGRTVQGVAVSLPEGYSGIVLRTEDDGKAKQKRPAPPKDRAKKGGRATRSSLRNSHEDVDEDEDVTMQVQEEDDDSAPCKTLRPTAKFSSFTLWNPDVDVDEGRDEYLRVLSEYQRLSVEVHRIDT